MSAVDTMATPKANKMLQLINYRMRITLDDKRMLVGAFMAFDKHMNIVLGDCEEFRFVTVRKEEAKEEREERRFLGLTLVRGECVVSLSVEGPPPKNDTRIKVVDKGETGPGVASVAAGRGTCAGGGRRPVGWWRERVRRRREGAMALPPGGGGAQTGKGPGREGLPTAGGDETRSAHRLTPRALEVHPMLMQSRREQGNEGRRRGKRLGRGTRRPGERAVPRAGGEGRPNAY